MQNSNAWTHSCILRINVLILYVSMYNEANTCYN